jgi:uncharacterized membrane protein
MRVRAYETTGYWLDELYALRITNSGSIVDILRAIPETDDNPPFYYLVLAAWRWAVGSSELITRSLSLLFSWIAVAVLTLSRKSLGSAIALGAAGLLAVLPGALYPVEARPYGLTLLLATLLVVVWITLLQATPRAHSKILIIWAVLAALLSITHYFGALLVAALTVAAVPLWRPLNVKVPLSRFVFLTMVSFAPLILWALFTRQSLIERSGGSHWLQPPPRTMSIDFLGWVVGGTFLSAVLIGLVLAALLALAVRWSELGEQKFLVVGLGMAVSIVLLGSQLISLWTPIWLDKYGVVLVPTIVLIASYIAYLTLIPRVGWYAVVMGLMVLAVLITNRDPRLVIPIEGWREVVQLSDLAAANRDDKAFTFSAWEATLWSAYASTVGPDLPEILATDEETSERYWQSMDFKPGQYTLIFFSPYSASTGDAKLELNLINCKRFQVAKTPGFGYLECSRQH